MDGARWRVLARYTSKQWSWQNRHSQHEGEMMLQPLARSPIAPICWKSRLQNSHKQSRADLSYIAVRQLWRWIAASIVKLSVSSQRPWQVVRRQRLLTNFAKFSLPSTRRGTGTNQPPPSNRLNHARGLKRLIALQYRNRRQILRLYAIGAQTRYPIEVLRIVYPVVACIGGRGRTVQM